MCELSQRKIECKDAQPAKQPASSSLADQRSPRYDRQRQLSAQHSSQPIVRHRKQAAVQEGRLLLRKASSDRQRPAQGQRTAASSTRLHHQQTPRSFLPGMARRDQRRRPESQSRHQKRFPACKMDAGNIVYDRTAGAGRSAAPRTNRTRPSSPAGETSSTKRNHIRKWQRD
jgi:hypothetical protein